MGCCIGSVHMTKSQAMNECKRTLKECKVLIAGNFSLSACEVAGMRDEWWMGGISRVKSVLDIRIHEAIQCIDDAERDARIPLVKLGQGDFERCVMP